MLEDARLKARGFEQEIRDAEQLAVEAHARIAFSSNRCWPSSTLTESGLLGSPVDELLTRAGEAAKDDGASGDRGWSPLAGGWECRSRSRPT